MRRPRMVSGGIAPGLPLVPTVLLADADERSRAMVRDALLEGTGPADLRVVEDTRELHDYLHRAGAFAEPIIAPRPALVLVDGGLPGVGGLDAVRAIKSNSALRRIPVVVLVSRLEPEHVAEAYDAGANTVIAKPVTFLALVKLMKVLTAYWFEAAALPQGHAA
jgi:CheY-like chemotaxis protein